MDGLVGSLLDEGVHGQTVLDERVHGRTDESTDASAAISSHQLAPW